ncbi:MAG: Ty1/Copia family ribonuclease HI [Micrococcales bacterium]|nr:Ty1/Copia family ribonuclease HI [Micrococcales bacterium]
MKPTLWCDNQSTIALTENPVFHSRTKHIELRYFFIRDLVQEGKIAVKHISTSANLADIFTKALRREQHCTLLRRLGLQVPTSSEKTSV